MIYLFFRQKEKTKSESSDSSEPSGSGSIHKVSTIELKDCIEADPEGQIDGLSNKAYETDINESTNGMCGNGESITDYTYVVHL